MKHASISIIAVLVTLFFSPVAFAQVCGDANNDGTFGISDFTTLLDYMRGGTPASFDSANADCDGIPGISISDVERMAEYIFQGGSLNCTLSGSYSFSAAPNDTIYLPRLLNVPDSITGAGLLVFSSFSSNVDGFYVPLLSKGTGSSSHFDLSSTFHNTGINIVLSSTFDPDTNIVLGIDLVGTGVFTGSPKNLLLLNYTRQTTGTADIVPEEFDFTSPLLFAVVINGDLRVPVVQYYDASSPEPFVISTRNIFLNASEDSLSTNSIMVDIDFPVPGVSFELDPSQSWINLSSTTGTTPATVTVSGDAIGLTQGNYAGTIAVEFAGIGTTVDLINVEMAVDSVIVIPFFPPGDANCDGSYDILDLVYTVDFIFRGGPNAFPCE
ncbi:MAG: hypothetical protein IIA17_10850 [candidate division Zixibacteria bacterium]|nr:hypothetical protein [candidate division Zixibacteria bacterium]